MGWTFRKRTREGRAIASRRAARPARAAALVVVLAAAGCATHSLEPPATQVGVASWYGPGFHGQKTASGETYNQHRLTAAHRSWPLGTRARVTNLDNGRAVTVRINDRGPYVDDRLLDLSYGAARELGMVQDGTCSVRIEPLPDAGGRPPGVVAFAVQIAAFADADRADAFRRDVTRLRELRGGSLRQPHENVYVASSAISGQPVYRVRVGPYTQRDEADIVASALARSGMEAIVVEEVLASR